MSPPADLPPVRSPRRVLWAAVFFAWGALLFVLLLTDGLNRYLAPRNRPFVLFGAVVLVALAVARWRRSAVPHRGDPDDALHDLHCRCRRSEAPRGSELVSVALFLVPLMVLAIVPAGTLGASAARSRGISSAALRPPPVPARTFPPVTTRPSGPVAPEPQFTVLDVVYAVSSPGYAAQSGISRGGSIELVGLVVKGGPAPPDGFLLTRFLVSCCVADAVPVGVNVVGPGALDAPDDAWVVVRGTLDWEEQPPGITTKRTFGTITLESLERVPAPSDPYVY